MAKVDNQDWTYEKASARLEEILAALGKGDLPLEESLKLFEEGTRLAAFCKEQLSQAKLRVEQLTASADESTAEPQEALADEKD